MKITALHRDILARIYAAADGTTDPVRYALKQLSPSTAEPNGPRLFRWLETAELIERHLFPSGVCHSVALTEQGLIIGRERYRDLGAIYARRPLPLDEVDKLSHLLPRRCAG